MSVNGSWIFRIICYYIQIRRFGELKNNHNRRLIGTPPPIFLKKPYLSIFYCKVYEILKKQNIFFNKIKYMWGVIVSSQ